MPEPTISLIAKDKRGESYSIKLPDGRELVLIHTLPGYYRGGHSHSLPEVSLLLSGRIHYKKKYDDVYEDEFEEVPGQVLFNNAGQPHLAYFPEESWLIDWKLREGPCQTTNYPPYRASVDAQL